MWNGTLYLRGGGDPTFGAVGFDQRVVRDGHDHARPDRRLLSATGITAVNGRIVGDESYFDSAAGTPATGYGRSSDVEGELSALAYDRGFTDLHGTAFQARPALFAAQELAGGLRAAGVRSPALPDLHRPDAGERHVARLRSVAAARDLIALTNAPSDNYLAETLLKDIGARLGGAGTTAAGAAVVRAELLSQFGIAPRLNDGSGLSRYDSTSPQQVVTLLQAMATNSTFVNSLAVAERPARSSTR